MTYVQGLRGIVCSKAPLHRNSEEYTAPPSISGAICISRARWPRRLQVVRSLSSASPAQFRRLQLDQAQRHRKFNTGSETESSAGPETESSAGPVCPTFSSLATFHVRFRFKIINMHARWIPYCFCQYSKTDILYDRCLSVGTLIC